MKTQFTKGKWEIIKFWFDKLIPAILIKTISGTIVFPYQEWKHKQEESEATAKLIIASPFMFYQWVIVAKEHGWLFAFQIIEEATGIDYKWDSDEFNQLAKEAKSFMKEYKSKKQ